MNNGKKAPGTRFLREENADDADTADFRGSNIDRIRENPLYPRPPRSIKGSLSSLHPSAASFYYPAPFSSDRLLSVSGLSSSGRRR